jgi:hypothetical protein
MVLVSGVQLKFECLQFPESALRQFVFVKDEFMVEVDREHDEQDENGDHDKGRGCGRKHRIVVELHPTQNSKLAQEQKDPEHCRKCPACFDVPTTEQFKKQS